MVLCCFGRVREECFFFFFFAYVSVSRDEEIFLVSLKSPYVMRLRKSGLTI